MKQFRTDIQGLRAIAVLSVVLFHFKPEWLPGGFIGVDIFFVISGYLMTSIVIKGIESERFTLKAFYIARVVRIVPALLVLCVVVSSFGFLLLNLVDASKLSTHAASSIAFVSNFVYWSESGYFDDASKENWLLHTWSLSVEWQFYLIYPVVILILSKFMSVKTIAKVTLFGVFAGLGFSIWASSAMPSAAYFLLPTRAWELLAGGLAFFYPISIKIGSVARTCIVLLGSGAILGSAFLLNDNYPWPGLFATIPVFATLFIIYANEQKNVLLNNVVSQKIGTWSYSIYLWHWPVVVFIIYFELPPNTWLLGIILAFVLGWISFTYCESKFGKKSIPSKQYGPKIVLTSFSLVLTAILVFVFFKGSLWQDNLDRVEPFMAGQQYFDGNKVKNATGGETYFFNEATPEEYDFVAIGDSNLSHYVYGITHENNKKVILSWEGACLSLPNYMTKPTESYMNKSWQTYCQNNYKNITKYPDKPIIIAQQWQIRELVCTSKPCPLESTRSNYFNILEQQFSQLIEVTGLDRQIIVIGQIPAPTNSVYRCMKGFNSEECLVESDESENIRIITNEKLSKIVERYPNVLFIDPFEFTCNEDFICKSIIGNKSIFHDEGHLSAFGSKYYWDKISSVISLNPLIESKD